MVWLENTLSFVRKDDFLRTARLLPRKGCEPGGSRSVYFAYRERHHSVDYRFAEPIRIFKK
jgi:hypothetical protein